MILGIILIRNDVRGYLVRGISMLSNSDFKTLNKLAYKITSYYPYIRDTDGYKSKQSRYLDKTMSCSRDEAILSVERFMIDARVKESREAFIAAFDIYCRLVGKVSNELVKRISEQHQTGKGNLKWYDIYSSEELLIWDMLRVHSVPELSKYITVRGYDYINSFKKYFLLYKSLTEKHMSVLKKHLFLEIAYNLYCSSCKDFGNDRANCSIINGLLQVQYSIDSNEINNMFKLVGNESVDALTVYDDGSDYVLLVEEYIPGDSVTPEDTMEHTYIVDPDTLEVFNDNGKFQNLQKIVLSTIEMANRYVGPVDVIRVENGVRYKGYVGLATGMDGFTEFLPYDTESERQGVQTSFVVM